MLGTGQFPGKAIRNSRALRSLAATLAICAALCAPASALAQERAPADPLRGIRGCAAIAQPEQRLACYDRESAAVLASVENGDIRLVERRDVERARRSLFGFTVPEGGLFGASAEMPDTLETTITGVRQTGPDAWAITVEEGSVWQISNAPSRFRAPRTGDRVVLKKAALGSVFIRVGGQLGVKGRRIG